MCKHYTEKKQMESIEHMQFTNENTSMKTQNTKGMKGTFMGMKVYLGMKGIKEYESVDFS